MITSWNDISTAISINKLNNTDIENKKIVKVLDYLDMHFSEIHFSHNNRTYYCDNYKLIRINYSVYLYLCIIDNNISQSVFADIILGYMKYKHNFIFDTVKFL